jgi:hypothetical protein
MPGDDEPPPLDDADAPPPSKSTKVTIDAKYRLREPGDDDGPVPEDDGIPY